MLEYLPRSQLTENDPKQSKKFNSFAYLPARKATISSTMLYVIGLGLSDEKDITVKGLEAVKQCERIYLESYTSILMIEKEKLACLAEPEPEG